MNVRGLIFMGLLLVASIGLVQAQTYERQWKKVEELEKKDLPKSVVEVAQTIYVKAEKEKNAPQMMKAFLTMMAYRNMISPDSLQVDLQKLETWASSSQTCVTDKAVLYSILGEMILLKGMDASQEEADKANDYLKKSLQDSLILVNYDAEKLTPLVVSKETSKRYFNNNLYELLARRAISNWETNNWRKQKEEIAGNVKRTYQSLLNIYQKKGMREAWLLTALDAFPNADEDTLRQWQKEYGDLDVCAEVYFRLSQMMRWKGKLPAERLAFIREGIERYPHYERINVLKQEEQEILLPRLGLNVDYAYPGKPVRLKVDYRNLEGFKLMLYWVDLEAVSPLLSKLTPQTIDKYGTLLKEEHINLPLTSNYFSRKEEVVEHVGGSGIYYWVAEPDGYSDLRQGVLLHMSSLMLAKRGIPGNNQEIVVLDKESGHPIPHAKVDLYKKEGEKYTCKYSFESDDQGFVKIDKFSGYHPFYWRAQTDFDNAMPLNWVGFIDAREIVSPKVVESIHLFTDRAIYRPGQSIRYSGIVYNQQNDSVWVKSDSEHMVTLLDANGRKVDEQKVWTDDFGTFQGTFDLPALLSNGVFRIDAGKGMATVRVEEYKRPTFEVLFDTIRNTYQAGDSIRIKGMARTFAGVPVSRAVVKYKVSRVENYFWRRNGIVANQVSGQIQTDDEGRFEIPVHLQLDENEQQEWFYTYEVKADVTSLAGETQTGLVDLPLGSSAYRINVPNWEGKTIAKEHREPLKFVVTNLKHVPIERRVDYELYAVEEKEDGTIRQIKLMCQGEALSNNAFMPDIIYDLPSGHYQLIASVKDDEGKTSECKVTFVLFSLKDKKVPVKSKVWCYQSGKEFDENGNATVCFGSSENDVCLFYDVYSNEQWIERKRLEFSDSLLVVPFKYSKQYGDGICVSFFFVKHGKMYARYMEIAKPRPDKKMQLSWKTFRNKLRPGSKETWVLNIIGKDGKASDAQMMATLYDASLEQMVKHNWEMNLDFSRYIPSYNWDGSWYSSLTWRFSFPRMSFEYASFAYSYMDIPMIKVGYRNVMRMYKSAGKSDYNAPTEVKYVEAAYELDEASVNEETSIDTDKVDLRTNFAETTFFYPQLRTNKKGEVSIEFTLPESLTTWRFMGLAHTRDMDYGELSASVTASKDFMLQPNLPRFVRVGDEVSFTASLTNLTEKGIKGTVCMELFNPETDKVWMVQKKAFRVDAKGTEVIQFSFKVKDEYEVLACRMVAESNKFSDGEQRYLPVLTDKRWMTESVSIDVDKAGTYRIPLDSLFNRHSETVTHPHMIVEFAGNPAWYAVQTLPVLVEPDNENAYSWAAAFYANTLAGYIVNSNPKIRQVMESWKNQKGNALVSPLQKNEELKELLLEETPWLSVGMDETSQKEKLITLFDLNALDYRTTRTINKLKELQNEEGAWSWYRGMPGNRFMTMQIVELLARLQTMTFHVSKNQEMDVIYRKAFGFLKKQARGEYEKMIEAEKKGVTGPLSEQILRYLYICALDVTLQPEKVVNDYFIHRLEALSAQLTIYGKSLAAIILHSAGKMEKADEFLQSVMEYSVVSEEMGRYFDTDKAPYSWFSYKIPTEVMALEAVNRLRNDESTIEQMKRWLLKQKQTQVWDMPIATVDAVYALLMSGNNWLNHVPSAELVLGKETFAVPGQQALGYIKKEIAGNVMEIKEMLVRKETDGMAWGTVYAQFLEQMDKVEAFANTLSVSRHLLKDGNVVSPDALEVGDRVTVRLTVSIDRDMDFVQLKDERAACMEPVNVLSAFHWRNGTGYYLVTKDSSTLFFFDQLRKGTHVLEYDVFITAEGTYQQGVASVQSVYAPEFGGHSASQRMIVK